MTKKTIISKTSGSPLPAEQCTERAGSVRHTHLMGGNPISRVSFVQMGTLPLAPVWRSVSSR
jgi:hypothetical protein